MTDPTPTVPAPTPGPLEDVVLKVIALQAQAGTLAKLKLTLSVAGQVITGTVIGRDAWFDAQVERAGDDHTRAFLRGFADAMRDDNDAADQDPDEGDNQDDASSFGYLHLIEAKYMTGPGLTQGQAMVRIRIEAIDSWGFGGATSV